MFDILMRIKIKLSQRLRKYLLVIGVTICNFKTGERARGEVYYWTATPKVTPKCRVVWGVPFLVQRRLCELGPINR